MDNSGTREIDPAQARAVSHDGEPQQGHAPARTTVFVTHDQMQVIRLVFDRDPTPAAAHGARMLSGGTGRHGSPLWSADGQHLVFTGNDRDAAITDAAVDVSSDASGASAAQTTAVSRKPPR